MSSAKKYTNDELLGIRNCQLEIYDAIAKICEKHSIRYTAVAGTVLGAVRHNGYIPWDDDFDIAMPRKDYEKFIEKAKDELDDRFFLQNYETEPTCINYFTKVRRNGTLFVQESDVSVNMHKGIFVDIFPLDNLPKASFMRKFFRFRQVIIYQFYIAKTTKGTMGDSKSFKGKIRRLTRGVLHVITVLFSKKKLYKSLDKLLKKYNANTTGLLMQSPEFASNGIAVPEDFLIETVKHTFEGREIPIPAKYSEYLTLRYGSDFMQLPPEEKRYNHRPYELKFN